MTPQSGKNGQVIHLIRTISADKPFVVLGCCLLCLVSGVEFLGKLRGCVVRNVVLFELFIFVAVSL